MRTQTRQTLLNLVRIVISVSLLTWVVARVGPGQLAGTLRAADWQFYALALIVSSASMGVRAYRWWILLTAVDVRVSFWRTMYLYYVGAFYSTFLPTGFGGDVMRVLEFGEGATSQQAAGTVLVDRLSGFIMLFALALAALPFVAGQLPLWITLTAAALAGGMMLGSALLFEGHILRRLTARFPRALSLAGDAWLGRTYAVITACGQRAIVSALFWSLIFNLLHVGAIALVGQALSLRVPLEVYFLFVPLATVALLIPLTVNGIGFREAIFITLFGQMGVMDEKAAAFSLGMYSLDLFDGIVGGVIYFGAGLKGLRRKT